MKRRILIFLSTVLLSLLVVPVAHILSAPNWEAIRWREKSFLFNMDFASRWVAKVLYPFGISTDPKQVIIGRDGWLYLGDQYEHTVSIDRRLPTSAEVELGKQISTVTDGWHSYLSSKGVKLFKIMVGPNKGTIYPEHMPNWAKSSSPNATDALLAETGVKYYVDLRGALLEAKANLPVDLYYKTDTHWNNFGAAIAFHAFARQVSAEAPDLRWPSDAAYELSRVVPRKGGDLAQFLRLSGHVSDLEPLTHALELPIETTQSNYDTKEIIHTGGNPGVGTPSKPLLVRSVGALNNKKVLWLRDSFGSAMSPLMAATFSDVLQLDWSKAIKPGGRLIELVEDWKPDYVFFTVVERASRAEAFAAPVVLPSRGDFKSIRSATPVASNNLIDGRTKSEYSINGNDPYIDFALSDAITPSEARYLSIDLTCDDGAALVPLQLFWLEKGLTYFDDEHSARFSFPTGQNLLDLHTLLKWKSAGTISRLRLDIDSQSACTRFKLNNPSLGLRRSGVDVKS